MASMLTFWRRTTTLHEKAPNELPGVTESASEETQEERVPPPTPEGLKPRITMTQLKKELHLDPPRLLHNDEDDMTFPQSMTLYTRDSSLSSTMMTAPIAESPNLAAPMTAVGALVAKNHHQQQQQHFGMSFLPPITWQQQQQQQEEEPDDPLRYHQLHDSLDATPRKHKAILRRPSNGSDMDSQTTSGDNPNTSHHIEFGSFSSQLGLVESAEWSRHPYNFEPVDDDDDDEEDELLVMGDHLTNVSAISQSTHDDRSYHSYLSHHSLHSLDSVRYSRASQQSHDIMPSYNLYTEGTMDRALLLRKRINQRTAKEQLLLDVIERLQDDVDLVRDLEGDGFSKTEGLLAGYSEKKRTQVADYVQSVLTEIETARPEEFFLSPSLIEDFADTHNDLQQSLHFLASLVEMADPNRQHQYKCKQEARAALGIATIPQSPETIRGGDTSLFSLPSESTTPHTSNVSMTTSITTKPSPASLPRGGKQEGRSMRRTIEIVTTLLGRMTRACDKIGTVRATEEMKRNYLQLMKLPNAHLELVVDAFYQILPPPPPPIVRQVSLEEEQEPRHLLYVFDQIKQPDDDLRRQVGSNDYDRNDVRDAAPEEEYDPQVRDFYHQEICCTE